MTAEERKELEAGISAAVDSGAELGKVLAPQYAGFIILGQAVAHALPGLYQDVLRLVHKQEPTAEDNSDLAAKIAALRNPETL